MSSSKARRGRSGRILLVLVMVLGLAFSALPVLGQDADLAVPDDVAAAIAAQKVEQPYIVMMAADPAIAYEGDIAGYKATKPAKDKKINPNSGAVQKYLGYLNGSHADALNGIGVGLERKFADYNVSFNGFAAMLTGAEVSALMARDDVLMVFEDELRTPQTDLSPSYLEMAEAWDAPGGPYLGEDVIIGVIDTGIWPENPSFSDQADLGDTPGRKNGKKHQGALAYGPAPADWYGTCQSGEQWSQDDCNNKLIGARYFVEGFGKQKALFSAEYLSARDWDGHGSHTASTAGGNVVESIYGQISGMAPRARIAMYKACWNSDPGSCASSDLVSAIDAAVADGVDVINYSIGGGSSSLATPDAIAFLFAADAGVFVATSNGNSGPDQNTTGNPAGVPWVTSVGAVAHRPSGGEVDLLGAGSYTGPSLADPGGTGFVSIVDASDHGNPLCYPSITFDPPITDEAVLCWRGDIARVDKSLAVFQQGGVAMILANVPGGAASTVGDVHSVPSIHVDAAAGVVIGEYVANDADPQVNIRGSLGPTGVVAGFSSRGIGGSPDLIKPDIAAPGVAVLAADAEVTFYGYNPTGVTFKGGTSMASPHIAGIGALLVEANPDWTPAMVKSALMTTADATATTNSDSISATDPFDVGSGLVQPGSALDPGLAYDAAFFDYLAFLCGAQPGVVSQGSCDFLESNGYSLDPSDLNVPSIAIGALAGTQTITRTVTNVGPAGTYEPSVTGLAGINVEVSPSSMTLDTGETSTFQVTFTNVSAGTGYQFGELTWTHGPHAVTSPLAIRPVAISAPAEIVGSGTSGSDSFDVQFGIAADVSLGVHGLVGPTMTSDNVQDDPASDFDTALGCWIATGGLGAGADPACGLTAHWIGIDPGTAFARFSLLDDFTDGADDLDLYVYDPDLFFAGGSGSGTSAEQVDVELPAAGTWLVLVHGWETDGPDSNYDLFTWFPNADEGNLTAIGAGGAVAVGETATIDLTWSGLDAGHLYLGAISYNDAGVPFGSTAVSIDTGFGG